MLPATVSLLLLFIDEETVDLTMENEVKFQLTHAKSMGLE